MFQGTCQQKLEELDCNQSGIYPMYYISYSGQLCHQFYVSLCIQFIVTSSGLITCKNTTISSKYLFIYTQAQTAVLYFKPHIKVKPC